MALLDSLIGEREAGGAGGEGLVGRVESRCPGHRRETERTGRRIVERVCPRTEIEDGDGFCIAHAIRIRIREAAKIDAVGGEIVQRVTVTA